MHPVRGGSGSVHLAILSVAVVAACAPTPALAQSQCAFVAPTRNFNQVTIAGGQEIIYMGTPGFSCADGVRIFADSAVAFRAQHLMHFIGHVRFHDTDRALEADDALYRTELGRLEASGHMILRDTVHGSVIENGRLDYLRKSSTRDVEQMIVTTAPDGVRPRARLYMRPAEDTASAADTMTVGRRERPDEVLPDSGAVSVPPDTAGVEPPDTAGVMPPDTASVAPADTTGRIPPDTTAATPPDTTVRPDSARSEPAGPPPLVRGRRTAPARPGPPGGPPGGSPPDTTQTPYIVEADRLELHGDSYFQATGTVHIDRDSLKAFSDTAEYDQAAGRILLNGSARVLSSGYDLAGRTVNISIPGGDISRVRALHHAVLTGDQLRMTAPTISVFMADGSMDRLVATPIRQEGQDTAPDSADLVQPVAVAEKFRLNADSLDVRAPAQVLDKMYAVGAARGESSAGDSLNVPGLPEDARKDWIEGDTLIVTFVKVEPRIDQPGDSAHYDLDRLVAQGNARSLYRILPSDSTARPGIDPPAVHYVLGKTITIVLDSGQVDHMEVEEPNGWHLEPLGHSVKDSTASTDTARVGGGGVVAAAPSVVAPSGTRPGGGPSPARRSRHDGNEGTAFPVKPGRERDRRRRRKR